MTTQTHPTFRTLLLAVSIEPQEIGQRIAAARNRRGWTQMHFAQAANVSVSSVQRWERGDLPPIRELIRLAGVLEIEPDQLVELEPTQDAKIAAIGRELRDHLDGQHEEVLRRLDVLTELVRTLSVSERARLAS